MALPGRGGGGGVFGEDGASCRVARPIGDNPGGLKNEPAEICPVQHFYNENRHLRGLGQGPQAFLEIFVGRKCRGVPGGGQPGPIPFFSQGVLARSILPGGGVRRMLFAVK